MIMRVYNYSVILDKTNKEYNPNNDPLISHVSEIGIPIKFIDQSALGDTTFEKYIVVYVAPELISRDNPNPNMARIGRRVQEGNAAAVIYPINKEYEPVTLELGQSVIRDLEDGAIPELYNFKGRTYLLIRFS